MRKNKNPGLTCRRGLCAALALVLVLGLAACGGKEQAQEQEPLRAPTEAAVPTSSVETAYGPLAFPEELFGNLRHMEVTDGSVAMEVFYMVGAEGEKELYRIHFADAKVGAHMGYLTTENGEITVTYSMCEYADEDFKSEDERKLYYSMMDAFSVIMNSLYADERFSETKAVAPVGDREVKLRYWTVTLPENVQYTETEENGIYRAEFYGEVSGERINLFMIGLGEMEAEALLGLYTENGVQKPVMVETYSLDDYAIWPEEEQTVIYKMMNALNTVIQTIVADENFTEAPPDMQIGIG